MKRFGVGFLLLMVVATSGTVAQPAEFTIDFNGLGITTRNRAAFTRQWDDFLIIFPAFPGIDFDRFTRVTIRADFFDINGNWLSPDNDMVMVTLIYDPRGDIRGPAMGPGPNTPLKQFNVGGPYGEVHTYQGSIVLLNQQPRAILFQNSSPLVRFIEVTEVTFHNR